MKDTDCIGFLQWALPRLAMCWRAYLDEHPEEWHVLDGLLLREKSRPRSATVTRWPILRLNAVAVPSGLAAA